MKSLEAKIYKVLFLKKHWNLRHMLSPHHYAEVIVDKQ